MEQHEAIPPLQLIIILVVAVVLVESSRMFQNIILHLMGSSAGQTIDGHRGPLWSCPDEILTSVFCHLPSFHEAFVLSSTCHLMQEVWMDNVETIYKHLARHSIPCERHARQFLALQGGPPLESGIASAKHVVQMMRNRSVVERAICTFEHQIVHRVESRSSRAEDYHGLGPLLHSPSLARTERSRFTRSYYQLWGMMQFTEFAKLETTLRSLTIKQLLHLQAIASSHNLTRGHQLILGSQRECFDINSVFSLEDPISGISILELMETEIDRRIYRYDNMNPKNENTGIIKHYAFGDGHYDFLIIWDNYQAPIKHAVRNTRVKNLDSEKGWDWEVWEESSDEDV